ncbi:MAG: MFS transporter [Anaerolineae bacterium]|nr:MFS transporter [Anaerolineae bacterium]
MKEIMHNRSLLLLALAESVSNIGNWITIMALYAIIVFHGEGSVMESSAIMLAGLGPMLVLSPVAGWLSDRFDRKWLMITSQVMSALPIIAIIIVGEGLAIYLLLAIQTAFATLMLPARQAVVPMLVRKQQLTQANALLQQINSFVKIGGPILGGTIVGLLGARNAMLLDVLSFALAAGVLLLLPSLPPPRQKAANDTPAQTKAAEQVVEPSPVPLETLSMALRRSARLRLLFLATFLAIVVIMGFDVLGSIYVRDVLLAEEGLFGALIGLVGLGSLLSAGWLMLRRRQQNPWQDLTWGLVLLSGIPLFMAVGFWVGNPQVAKWIAAFAVLVGGLGNGLVSVQVGTLLQVLSPPALLGRMGGIFQSTITAGQMAAILVTPLLVPAYLSIGLYFALSASALILLALALVTTLRRLPAQEAENGVAEALPESSAELNA